MSNLIRRTKLNANFFTYSVLTVPIMPIDHPEADVQKCLSHPFLCFYGIIEEQSFTF